MQPGSASGAGASGGNRQLKRWGPIAGIVAVAAIGIGVFVATGGDDDSSSGTTVASTDAPGTTGAGTDTTVGDTSAPTTGGGGGEITYPLTYSQAVEQGVADQIDWGARMLETMEQGDAPQVSAGTA